MQHIVNHFEIHINFKSKSSFFTAFKLLYNKFHTYMTFSQFNNEIQFKSVYGKQKEDIKKIVNSLKRKPKYMTIKEKKFYINKEIIEY